MYNTKRILPILLSLLFFYTNIFSQNTKAVITNITLTENNRELVNGFCGGLNSPVISEINLNNDAYPDLYIFDKYGDKSLTFINQGPGKYPTYIYEPAYESIFPKDLWGWAIIRDFNKDGIPDIFGLHITLQGRAICVYKGSIVNSQLKFNLFLDEVRYSFNGNYSRMWCYKGDLPGFIDVNNDGDLDALIFNNAGGSNLEYYENQSIEKGHHLDSLDFLLTDLCWGRFIENSLNNSLTPNYCKTDGGLQIPHSNASRHQGGTLFTFDYEGDRDIDILMGDVSYNNLIFARNDGDTAYSQVNYFDSIFPIYDTPINLPLFPAAYPIDYNNDGKKDLMIAPFTFETQLGTSMDFSNIIIYENRNTPGLQQYTYKGDTFFVNQLFDLGSTSRALFHDVDNDGKKDILIGLSGKFRPAGSPIGQLAFLRNTSTANDVKFDVVNRDWCSLEQFNFNGLYPAIGDLDGDNLPDLIVGDNYGYMQFFKNNGTATPYTSITSPQYYGIDVGSNAYPFIFDLNKDGLQDVIVGNESGKVHFYWNYGTTTQPKFNADSSNTFLGNIRVNDWQKPITTGNATPIIFTENGKDYLISGSERGVVFKYLVNTDSLRKGTFTAIDTNLINTNYDIGTSIPGERNAISVADINGDGKYDYLLSGIRGGIKLISDSNWNKNPTIAINEIEDAIIFIYPNPALQSVYVQFPNAMDNDLIQLFDMNGRLVLSDAVKTYNNIDISNLESGTYLMKITTPNSVSSRKIMVLK